MERRLSQGFWLKDNTLYEGSAMINEGNENLTADWSSAGVGNRMDLNVTNADASYTYVGALYANFYPTDGYITPYNE